MGTEEGVPHFVRSPFILDDEGILGDSGCNITGIWAQPSC